MNPCLRIVEPLDGSVGHEKHSLLRNERVEGIFAQTGLALGPQSTNKRRGVAPARPGGPPQACSDAIRQLAVELRSCVTFVCARRPGRSYSTATVRTRHHRVEVPATESVAVRRRRQEARNSTRRNPRFQRPGPGGDPTVGRTAPDVSAGRSPRFANPVQQAVLEATSTTTPSSVRGVTISTRSSPSCAISAVSIATSFPAGFGAGPSLGNQPLKKFQALERAHDVRTDGASFPEASGVRRSPGGWRPW